MSADAILISVSLVVGLTIQTGIMVRYYRHLQKETNDRLKRIDDWNMREGK